MIDKAVAASERLVSFRDLARRLFGDRYDDEIFDARRLIAGLAVEEHDGNYIDAFMRVMRTLKEAGKDDPGTTLRLSAATVDLSIEKSGGAR
ncbi:MAG: hypothetical protein AAGA22_04740 [Pseudomonadota bacterium]